MKKIYKRFSKYSLGLLTLLGTVLFFYNLGKESLWQDEASSVYFSKNLFFLLKTMVTLEINMWLYYVILHFWLMLGESEFMVRSLSVIFALFTIPGIYWLGKISINSKVGKIAAFLFVINTYFISFAQEARSYSLFICLLVYLSIVLYYCIKVNKYYLWILYVLVALLAIYSHIYTIILLTIQFVTIILFKNEKKIILNFFYSGIVIFLFSTPLIFLMKIHLKSIGWIQKPSFEQFLNVIYSQSSNSWILGTLFIFLSWIACVNLYQSYKEYPNKWIFIYFVLWAFLPLISLYLFSILIRPLFTTRYFALSAPGYIILVAIGIDLIKNKYYKLIIFLIIIITSIFSLTQYHLNYRKDQWREGIIYISNNWKPKDKIIVFPAFTNRPIWYYMLKNRELKNKSKPILYIRDYYDGKDELFPEDIAALNKLLNSNRIWFISSHDLTIEKRKKQRDLILQSIKKEYNLKNEFKLNNSIKIFLFEKQL